ncbi:glycosyltransferase [Alkalihalobacillus sp. MEB130]|uniref:glycosyltransferase family 4 protein n=1 Tax=Alkalihalobacillus sp. MEB130 TaxID=2976704 RepID=UPI0028DF6791|nr:glycosyltransferase [Alkalihalobacillus sp. MEB130]MDT8860607.1 glycosyltransferase [Alkalihalobacillus sp. MEB130]
MKILMICTEKLPVPAVRGGAIQTYIDGVSASLKKEHDLTILGTSDPSLPDDEVKDHIRYVRTQGGLIEVYREGVKKFLQENTFDVIHIFNRPRLVLPVRECAPNARIILSMHNDMFKPEKIDPEEAEAVIDELDKIITVSDYIGRTISDPFPKAKPKLKTIYSGVDISRFVPPQSDQAKEMRQSIRKEYDLEGKKVILFTGRLSPNKGVDVLIRAMPELAKEHPNVALIIVGSKWFSVDEVTDYIAYVRALAARLPIPVINTGFVHPTEIQKWFAASDVFVCTSQWQEPLARVHYEAMASGLPIITTNRGGNAEVIEPNRNGYVIDDPQNPSSFVEHLTTLLSDPALRKKLGNYGRKLAEEHYTWSRVIKDIREVWNEVEERIKNGIQLDSLDVEKEEEMNQSLSEEHSVNVNEGKQTDPIEDVIEDLNEQLQSTESEEEVQKPTSEPIEDVIEDLNEQLHSTESEDFHQEKKKKNIIRKKTSLTRKPSITETTPDEEHVPLENVIEDLHEQIETDEHQVPEGGDDWLQGRVPLEEVIEDLNDQMSSTDRSAPTSELEDSRLKGLSKNRLKQRMSRQSQRRTLLLSELSSQDDLLDILLSKVQERTTKTGKRNQSTDSEKTAVNSVIKDLQSLLKNQQLQSDKKKELIETVNDITTAKLFNKLQTKRNLSNKKRRR